MTNNEHSMEAFKAFIKQHPALVKEVRRGVYSWQEVYEDWFLLGEEDSVWADFREGPLPPREKTEAEQKEEKEGLTSLFEALKGMDVQSMQKHVSNLSQALGTISGVISQFQGSPKPEEKTGARQQPHPFAVRKD